MKLSFLFPLLLLVGCTHKAQRAEYPTVDLEVPLACVTKVERKGCDVRKNPPRCQRTEVTYKNGCEEIRINDTPAH